MTKQELVAAVAREAGLTKTDAERAINAFTKVVLRTVKRGAQGTLERAMRGRYQPSDKGYRLEVRFVGQPLAVLFMPEYAPLAEDFAERIRTDVVSDCEVELGSFGQPSPPRT